MRPSVSLAITIVALFALTAACSPAPTATPKPAAPTSPPTAPAVSGAAATTPTAAPAAAPTPAAKIKRGGTIRVGIQGDISNMDPQINDDWNLHYHLLYNALFVARPVDLPGKWKIEPSLAESWELQGKTLTAKLRKGVKFHDGSEFNAEVAKFNIERLIKLPKSSAKALVESIDGADVVDPYTVRINLKYPSAPAVAVLSQGASHKTYMVSKTAAEKWGDEYTRHPSGTGPMELVDWKVGDQSVYKKFAGYWEKGADGQPLPYLDGAIYRFIVDDSIRFLELRAGNLEVMDLLAAKDLPAAKSAPNVKVDEKMWQGNHYWLTFNDMPSKETVFYKSKGLRQAIGYAIDREALAKTLGMGSGKAWQFMVAEGQLGYSPSLPKYTFDTAKAKRMVVDAGFPDGLDVTLTVHTRTIDQQQAQMLQKMFEPIGVRMNIEVMERVALNAKIRAGLSQFSTGRGGFALDPDLRFNGLTSISTNNWGNWENKDYDKCVEDARSTYDEKVRQQTYEKCSAIVYEEAPYHYNWVQIWTDAISVKVKDWIPDWAGFFDLRSAWLDN